MCVMFIANQLTNLLKWPTYQLHTVDSMEHMLITSFKTASHWSLLWDRQFQSTATHPGSLTATFLHIFPAKPCMHVNTLPCMPHTWPISFSLHVLRTIQLVFSINIRNLPWRQVNAEWQTCSAAHMCSDSDQVHATTLSERHPASSANYLTVMLPAI